MPIVSSLLHAGMHSETDSSMTFLGKLTDFAKDIIIHIYAPVSVSMINLPEAETTSAKKADEPQVFRLCNNTYYNTQQKHVTKNNTS